MEADFHNKDTDTPIVMELIFQAEDPEELKDDATAKWFDSDGIARVRKVWQSPDSKGVKYSYDPNDRAWIEGGFGGFDTILQNRLPEPIHIRPDMTTTELKSELQKLFKEIIQRYISSSDTVAEIDKLLDQLVTEIESDEYINSVQERISQKAREVFPDLSLKIQNPVSNKGLFPLLDKQTDVSVSFGESPDLTLERHGYGSQRVFIMSALSALTTELAAVSKRTKPTEASGGIVIQIEEPELFLSPNSVRKMKSLLYELAAQDKVQVIGCTHSPVMIDFSRPKQTIALIDKSVDGTRIFQSDCGDVDSDRNRTLQLAYKWNPALSEAIFADKVVLLEGETEFACLTRVLEIEGNDNSQLDIHIIDCKGKGSLKHFQRLLREFNKRYIVIHDLDVKYDPDNPGIRSKWNENEAIWSEISKATKAGVSALGFIFDLDFESAHGYTAKKPKMFHAMNMVDQRNSDEELKNCELYRAFEAVRDWASPYKGIEELRAL